MLKGTISTPTWSDKYKWWRCKAVAEDGRRISPRSLRNHWQKWHEAHGISLTLHELRHTFISYSRLKTEISLDDLKLLYGHSKAMDTDGTYVHEITLSPEEIKKQREERKKESTIIDTTFLNIIKSRIQ